MLTPLKENRRLRFLHLMETKFHGKQRNIADAIGIIPNLVSRYARGTKGIGDEMRPKIEAACGLPRGWLDEPAGDRDKSHASSGNALDVLLSADAAETSQEVASPGRIEEKPAIDFSAVDAALNGVLALYGLTLDDYIAARSANGKPRSASSDFSVESVSRRTRGPAKKRPAHGRS